jgi:hypothetical protein
MNKSVFVIVIMLVSIFARECSATLLHSPTYVVPSTTGYKPPTTAAYDYAWQLYQDVFNGSRPYNRYMGPWVLMTDFIDVYMQADILDVETIVSLRGLTLLNSRF